MQYVQKLAEKFCCQKSSNPSNIIFVKLKWNKKSLWPISHSREIAHRHLCDIYNNGLENFVNIFFRGVRIHFCVENIYGRAILFFARFMPTNGFAQPFVGIISFLSVNHGGDGEIRTLETLSRLHDFQSCALDQLGDISKIRSKNRYNNTLLSKVSEINRSI